MTTKPLITLTTIAALCCYTDCRADVPGWLEADSAAAIAKRTAGDFPYTVEEASEIIRADFPDITDAQIADFIQKKYLETKDFNGQKRVFRKGPRNLMLLNPEMNGGVTSRGATASPKRISYVDSVLSYYHGKIGRASCRERV